MVLRAATRAAFLAGDCRAVTCLVGVFRPVSFRADTAPAVDFRAVVFFAAVARAVPVAFAAAVLRVEADFAVVAFFAGAFFAAVVLRAAAGRVDVVFFAVDFFATVFFGAAFLAMVFFAVLFLTAACFAVDLAAVVFFAAVRFAVAFLAAVDLAVVVFFAVVDLAVVAFFAGAVLALFRTVVGAVLLAVRAVVAFFRAGVLAAVAPVARLVTVAAFFAAVDRFIGAFLAPVVFRAPVGLAAGRVVALVASAIWVPSLRDMLSVVSPTETTEFLDADPRHVGLPLLPGPAGVLGFPRLVTLLHQLQRVLGVGS